MPYLFVDGNNLAARCFFAQLELHTKSGHMSGLVHGLLKSLAATRASLNVKLSDTVVFWDGGRSKRRLEIYPEYKAGRRLSEPKTEEDIRRTLSFKEQLRAVKALLATRPIRQVEVPGAEADDLISLLAATVNDKVILLSRDHDMHQLVTDQVVIFDPELGVMSQERVAAHWGLPSFDKERILLLRAIQGDSGDNIKGVPSIGPKRAIKVEPYIRVDGLEIVQTIECKHQPTQKLIDRVIEHKITVLRNLDLMRLPGDWTDTYYEPEQIEAGLSQFLTIPDGDWSSWAAQCSEWELVEVLDAMERWV